MIKKKQYCNEHTNECFDCITVKGDNRNWEEAFSVPRSAKVNKASPPSEIGNYSRVCLSCLWPLAFLLPQSFIYIIWLSNMFIVRVPDESYPIFTPCALNLISKFFLFPLLVAACTFRNIGLFLYSTDCIK